MKINQLRKELVKCDKNKLLEILKKYRRELFDLNFNSATAHIKDYSRFKKSRKNIARILTVLRQNFNKNGNIQGVQ